MNTRKIGFITAVTIAAVLPASCVDTDNRAKNTPVGTSEGASIPVNAPPAEVPAEDVIATSTAASPEQCSTDPTDSGFGQFLEQSKVPVGELGHGPSDVIRTPGWFYHFQMDTNGYDSCAALSYIVLNGSNGDEERSAGTGASIADSVVLFNHGEMITAPAPFEMKTVENVTRISDSAIEVVYGHAGGATAEGVTEHHTFTFIYKDGLSGTGSLPAEIDSHLRLFLN